MRSWVKESMSTSSRQGRSLRRRSTMENMSTQFITASYRWLSSLAEIRDHEARRAPAAGIPEDCIRTMPEDYPHEVFNSRAIAAFQDGKWVPIGDGDLGALIDDPQKDCKVAWLSHYGSLALGTMIRTNERQCLDSESWLNEEVENWGFDDLLQDALKELEKNPELPRALEARIDAIYTLQWESSVDWESGIDEGNFTVGQTMFAISTPS